MTKAYLQIEACTSENLIVELEKRFAKIIDLKLSKLHPTANEDRYMSRQEVADLLGLTLVSVHRLMNAGILKPYKFGHSTRFLLSEVKAAASKTGRKMGVSND